MQVSGNFLGSPVGNLYGIIIYNGGTSVGTTTGIITEKLVGIPVGKYDTIIETVHGAPVCNIYGTTVKISQSNCYQKQELFSSTYFYIVYFYFKTV